MPAAASAFYPKVSTRRYIVAMDGGGGVNTYPGVASGLLGVLRGSFLATHDDRI